MLSELEFFAGSTAGGESLKVDLTPLTIIVGPNNSGKSRSLAEILSKIKEPELNSLVVKAIGISNEKAASCLYSDKFTRERKSGDYYEEGLRIVERRDSNDNMILHLREYDIENFLKGVDRERNTSASLYLSLFCLMLDGQSRLGLIEDQVAGDLMEEPKKNIQMLFKDNKKRELLREVVFDAFNKYLVIDPTNLGNLRYRLSDRSPKNEDEEKSLTSEALEFYKKTHLVSSASDGVKSFIGTVSTLIAGDPVLTLIDEPEAFLHPSLAMKLGKDVARIVAMNDSAASKQVIVSTHSANFIMGCIQGGADVNIIRLTYDYESSTARILKKEQLTHLMRNPLLRSVGVLNALFYNAVIVTEADSDRAFYQEVNERLLESKDGRGIEGCLFLNAQNKQTICDIVGPLRKLGIPACGILDIDAMNLTGGEFTKLLESAYVPEIKRDSFRNEKAKLFKLFDLLKEERGINYKTEGGVSLLEGENKEVCESFFSDLSAYGVFVVPRGELESWLSNLNVSRGKHAWLRTIFEAMGEDPNSKDYVKPSSGDVWEFINNIGVWVKNKNRKGMPT